MTTELIEIKPGLKFPDDFLRDAIPDVETCLFVGQLFHLSPAQMNGLLYHRFRHLDVVQALASEGEAHSEDLQDYLIELGYAPQIEAGEIVLAPKPAKGEVLPHLWEQAKVEIAKSIADVADKIKDVVASLEGKKGEMVFKSLATMNAKRPVIGDYKAQIHHARQVQNLGILDVSGSMTEETVRKVIEDWVALGYEANLHMAIVSNTCTYWEPGQYDVDTILAAAEYGGTQYEMLAPLFDRDWGTVITLADYDSSYGAKSALAQCTGTIEQVLDISLVNRPTFLSECVGQLANSVRPLLVTNTRHVLR